MVWCVILNRAWTRLQCDGLSYITAFSCIIAALCEAGNGDFERLISFVSYLIATSCIKRLEKGLKPRAISLKS